MSAESPQFNDRQTEELAKFDHLLNTIGVWEPQADNGMQWQYIETLQKPDGKQTKRTTNIFDVNQRLMGVLDRMGFHMYEAFEKESPEMQAKADELLQIHQMYKEASETPVNTLVALWEAPETIAHPQESQPPYEALGQ